MTFHFTSIKMANILKNRPHWVCWQGHGVRGALTLGLVNSLTVPKNVKKGLPYNLAIPLLVSTQEKWKHMFTMRLIHKCSQQHYSRQPKSKSNYPTAHQLVNKQNMFHSDNRMEYYVTTEGYKVMIHAKVWMNLKNINLSKRSQMQKPHIKLCHLYEMFRKGTSIETESRWVVASSWRVGWELRGIANRHEISFGDDRNVLKLNHRNNCTNLKIY